MQGIPTTGPGWTSQRLTLECKSKGLQLIGICTSFLSVLLSALLCAFVSIHISSPYLLFQFHYSHLLPYNWMYSWPWFMTSPWADFEVKIPESLPESLFSSQLKFLRTGISLPQPVPVGANIWPYHGYWLVYRGKWSFSPNLSVS